MAKVMEKGKEYGLSDKFLSTVFAAIHEASVDVQNEIISKQK
jgi:chorismate mutase